MARANRLFDERMLQTLARPERWRLVSLHALPDVAPVSRPNAARLQWTRRHAHGHPNPEFLLVLSGRGHHGYDGKLYPTRPGTAFFFDSLEQHDLGYPRSAPDAEYLWCSLLADRVFAFVLSVRHGRWSPSGRKRCMLFPAEAGIAPLAFLHQPDDQDALPPEWRRHRLLAALHAIAVKVVEKGYEEVGSRSDRDEFQRQVIEAVKQHIDETAGRGLSLAGLARIAGYSKFHFLRLFKHHTGHTALEYINQARRERVREMLSDGRSHKEIGAALGFSCPAAFSRWYRQQA